MPRFFVAASNIFGGIAYLNAKEIEHIKACVSGTARALPFATVTARTTPAASQS